MLRSVIAMLFLAFATPALAQSAVNCPIYDTTVLSVGNSKLISNCSLNNGPYDTMFTSIVGETTCQTGNSSEFTAAVGLLSPPTFTGPGTGAHIRGTISGGVLSVNSMVTPFPGFGITLGDYLHDGQSGAGIPSLTTPSAQGTHLTVVSQIDGTTGGVGHYSVSDATVNVAVEEDIWSLPTYYGSTTARPPSSVAMLRNLDVSACSNGKTYIFSADTLVNAQFNPNINMWLTWLFSGPLSGGGTTSKSASFNNGQMTMFSLATYSGGPAPAPSGTKGGLVRGKKP